MAKISLVVSGTIYQPAGESSSLNPETDLSSAGAVRNSAGAISDQVFRADFKGRSENMAGSATVSYTSLFQCRSEFGRYKYDELSKVLGTTSAAPVKAKNPRANAQTKPVLAWILGLPPMRCIASPAARSLQISLKDAWVRTSGIPEPGIAKALSLFRFEQRWRFLFARFSSAIL